ncbi:MAG TPA: hypothetical protein VNE58_08925 [Casimicrobiaceae bacterium]|nr:hypothetical protein [Casimicrobiaceae bacterium]
MRRPTTLRSNAWLLRGKDPGSASDWQLRKLERDLGVCNLVSHLRVESIVVFDVLLEDVRVTFPRYYFSGGLKVHIKDAVLRL